MVGELLFDLIKVRHKKSPSKERYTLTTKLLSARVLLSLGTNTKYSIYSITYK